MSVAAVRRVVSRLETDGPPTDATLVAAITTANPEREAAFAELVARYGPMVLGVCRRILTDAHDAEDAFQAVFLVLARKAKNIQPPGAVGGWLHGVAVRTAQKAKIAAARRRRREMIATARANSDHKAERQAERAADELHRAELRAVIDAELAALPEMQRAAVVLCDLHGRTRADAATALNRPEGTVAAWLARGRKTLAARLARRGIVLPAAGLVAVATPVAVSAELTSSVVATFLGRNANAAVLALAEGVMRSLSTSAKLGGVLVTASTLLIAVATAMAWQPRNETSPNAEVTQETPQVRTIPVDTKPDVKPSEWSEKRILDLAGWLGGSVAYSADGKTLFVGGTSGHAEAYDVATWKKLWAYKGGEYLAAVAVAPDGKTLATTFTDSESSGVQFLDSATGKAGDKLEEENALKEWPEPIAAAWFPNVTLLDGRGSTVHKVIFGNAREYVTKSWIDVAKPSTIKSSLVAAGKKPADEYAAPIAVSPDGLRVVVTGPIDRDTGKNVLWAWSAGSGAGNKLLEGHKATVVSAAWSKDGKFIVTGDSDGVVIVWNGASLTNFKEMSRLNLGGRVASVAIADDSKHIAAAVVKPQEGNAYTEKVFVWPRANPPKKPESISSHRAGGPFRGVASVAFAPDGMSLVSTFANFDHLTKLGELVGKVRVFVLKSPEQPEKPAPVGKLISDVSFSPDGKIYLVVSGGEVKAFDTATRKQLYAVVGESARFTADGKKLFVMATKIQECEPTTGKTLKEYDRPKTKWGWHQVVFSPDGKRFAAHFGLFVGVYDTATGTEVKLDEQFEMAGYLANAAGEQVSWSPNGKYLLANGVLLKRSVRGVAVWDVEAGKRTQSFEPTGTEWPRVAAFSADGKQIAIASEKRTEIWSDGKLKAKLGEQGLVTALAFHPDGKQIAVGMRLPQLPGGDLGPSRVIGYKTQVRLIDIATDKASKAFDDFESNVLPVTALTYSPDGTKLIAATGIFALDELPKELPQTGELKVFDLTKQDAPTPPPAPAGRQWTDVAVLTGHQSLVNGVAVAPDGKSFAAATETNVTCWDSATHKVLWTYKPTDSVAFALAYSPDGKHLWVTGKNAVFRLDAQSGKNAKPLDELFEAKLRNFNFVVKDSHARAITLSEDGKLLACSDGYMAWMLDLEDPVRYGTFGAPTPKDAPPAPSGVALSPDGKLLAAIHPKHTKRTFPSGVTPDTHWPVRIWSTDGKGLVRSLLGHDDRVTALEWSKDGKVIASGDEKGTVILWDAETGKELWRRTFRGRDNTDGRINSLAISLLDNTIAAAVSLGSGKSAERVVFLDPLKGKELDQLTRPERFPVSSVAWSKDGTFLVVGCGAAGQPVVQWDPMIGEVVVWKRKP